MYFTLANTYIIYVFYLIILFWDKVMYGFYETSLQSECWESFVLI